MKNEILTVNLIDINDHAPEFPDIFEPEFDENLDEGTFPTDLVAIDYDDGDNARVSYEILSITPSKYRTNIIP